MTDLFYRILTALLVDGVIILSLWAALYLLVILCWEENNHIMNRSKVLVGDRVNLFFSEMSVAKVNLPRLKSFKGPDFSILCYLYLFDPSW